MSQFKGVGVGQPIRKNYLKANSHRGASRGFLNKSFVFYLKENLGSVRIVRHALEDIKGLRFVTSKTKEN